MVVSDTYYKRTGRVTFDLVTKLLITVDGVSHQCRQDTGMCDLGKHGWIEWTVESDEKRRIECPVGWGRSHKR